MSEAELREKITALGNLDDETRNAVVCALIGHSRIQTGSWGYFYCARCGALLGDALGGFYAEACEVVLVGRDNERCRENYKKCT